MKFFGDFFRAIGNCFKGFGLLFEKGLWPFIFIPLIVWLLMWIGTLYGFFILADGLAEWMKGYFSFDSIPDAGHWLSFAKPFLVSKLGLVLGWILKFIFWFISGTFIKYVMLILLSPVFALLSEKAEEKLTGRSFPFSFSQLLKDILRGVLISLRNMFLEYLFMFICFLLTLFFPPLFFVTAPFLLLVGWYFIGFSLIDYNCERHRLGVGESVRLIRNNKGYACGTGMVYSFFLAFGFLPLQIVGMMFGPSVAVIGGTMSFLQMKDTTSPTRP